MAELQAILARLEQRRTALTDTEIRELKMVFPIIVRTHHPRVWDYLRKRRLGEPEAEDVVQESLWSLFGKLCGGFPDDLQAEFLGHARNHLLHYLRDKIRDRDRFTIGAPSSGSERPQSSQPDLDRMLDLRDIHKLPERLDHDERDVILLVDFHDLTHAEAGEVLGIPEGTVKTRLTKARQRLMQMIKQIMPPSQR